jgi:hypothetical protein
MVGIELDIARRLTNLRGKIVIKHSVIVAASAMLVATIVLGASARQTYAADEVNCNAVMNELHSAKHPKEVAKDLSISISSVYRCKRHAQAAGKARTKTSLQAQRRQDLTVPRPAASPSTASSAPIR